jgi:hypothetical protein
MVAKPAALHYGIATYAIDTGASPAERGARRGGGHNGMVVMAAEPVQSATAMSPETRGRPRR